nr:hypothetical protein [Chloroflexota bacterium]
MRYADSLLSDGEAVVLRHRQHWLALIVEARLGLVLVALAVVLLGVVVANPFGQQPDVFNNAISYVALASLVVGLILTGIHYWQWWAQDYMITNRRILKVEGIINKRSSDSSLEKIND